MISVLHMLKTERFRGFQTIKTYTFSVFTVRYTNPIFVQLKYFHQIKIMMNHIWLDHILEYLVVRMRFLRQNVCGNWWEMFYWLISKVNEKSIWNILVCVAIPSISVILYPLKIYGFHGRHLINNHIVNVSLDTWSTL